MGLQVRSCSKSRNEYTPVLPSELTTSTSPNCLTYVLRNGFCVLGPFGTHFDFSGTEATFFTFAVRTTYEGAQMSNGNERKGVPPAAATGKVSYDIHFQKHLLAAFCLVSSTRLKGVG